jgi:hypothetical protein
LHLPFAESGRSLHHRDLIHPRTCHPERNFGALCAKRSRRTCFLSFALYQGLASAGGAPSKLRLGGSDSGRSKGKWRLQKCWVAPGLDSETGGTTNLNRRRSSGTSTAVPIQKQRHRFKIIPAQSTHTLVIASLPATKVTIAITARPTANGRSNVRVKATRTTSSSTPSVTTGPNSAIQR